MNSAPMAQPFLAGGSGNTAAQAGVAVIVPPPPAKLLVTVHKTGKIRGVIALILHESIGQFFQTAKSKRNFKGSFSRVSTRSGGEITSLDATCQDNMLWLSAGDEF